MNLIAEIPDIEVFLSLQPEELAAVVLMVAHENRQQSGLMHPQSCRSQIQGDSSRPGYASRVAEAELAFDEAEIASKAISRK